MLHQQRFICPICFEKFDSAYNLPRILECGRVICTGCIFKINGENNEFICPFDRKVEPEFSLEKFKLAVHHIPNINLTEDVPICSTHQLSCDFICLEDACYLCTKCLKGTHMKHNWETTKEFQRIKMEKISNLRQLECEIEEQKARFNQSHREKLLKIAEFFNRVLNTTSQLPQEDFAILEQQINLKILDTYSWILRHETDSPENCPASTSDSEHKISHSMSPIHSENHPDEIGNFSLELKPIYVWKDKKIENVGSSSPEPHKKKATFRFDDASRLIQEAFKVAALMKLGESEHNLIGISKKWLQKWRVFVSFDEIINGKLPIFGSFGAEPPGPLNIEILVDHENTEIESINEDVWKLLSNKYNGILYPIAESSEKGIPKLKAENVSIILLEAKTIEHLRYSSTTKLKPQKLKVPSCFKIKHLVKALVGFDVKLQDEKSFTRLEENSTFDFWISDPQGIENLEKTIRTQGDEGPYKLEGNFVRESHLVEKFPDDKVLIIYNRGIQQLPYLWTEDTPAFNRCAFNLCSAFAIEKVHCYCLMRGYCSEFCRQGDQGHKCLRKGTEFEEVIRKRLHVGDD